MIFSDKDIVEIQGFTYCELNCSLYLECVCFLEALAPAPAPYKHQHTLLSLERT